MIHIMIPNYFFKLLFSILPFAAFSQQPVISIIVNGKTIGRHILTEEALVIPVQKSRFKNISSVSLMYKEQNSSNVYKRSLDITNDDENLLYHITPLKSKPGLFSIDIKAARKIMMNEKSIRIYLLEDPANKMMALPSRRKLLAALHFI